MKSKPRVGLIKRLVPIYESPIEAIYHIAPFAPLIIVITKDQLKYGHETKQLIYHLVPIRLKLAARKTRGVL